MAENVEIIVKYTGDIKALGERLNTSVEVLNSSYAIMMPDVDTLRTLHSYPEIEYIEYSSKLTFLDNSTMSSSCITDTHSDPGFNLTGNGVAIAILDSGIDFRHPDFINEDGTTRILRIWDQSIPDGPNPKGFSIGTEFTEKEINEALKDSDYNLAHQDFNGHGTAVAGVCAGNGRASSGQNLGSAPNASLIIVKLAVNQTSFFTSTANLMRGVSYAINTAMDFSLPVVVNISYGNSQGSHDGETLFEQYLDSMCDFWHNSIVVATGNEGIARHHFGGIVQVGEITSSSFILKRGLTTISLTFCKDFTDIFNFQIRNSSGEETQKISLRVSSQALYLSNVEILVAVMEPNPFYDEQLITFLFRGLDNRVIPEDIWTIDVEGINVINGKFDIWLPVTDISGTESKFLNPDSQITLTIPSTAYKVISVGGYDSFAGNIADFSGKGPTRSGEIKPDLVAPAIGVTVTVPGGTYGSLSGTSFAAPHVSGACALLMEWGLVKKNDLYMYNQRLKSFLKIGATRNSNLKYPNPMWGFGTLCARESLNMASQYALITDSHLLSTLYYENLISPNTPQMQIADESTDDSNGANVNNSLPVISIDEPIDANLEKRMLNRMQTQKEVLKVNPILDESYIDYLIKYDAPSEQFLREIPNIVVSTILQGGYAIAHVPLETQKLYENIFENKVFAEKAMICAITEDSQAFLSAGITSVKNQIFLKLSGNGVIFGVVDTGIDIFNDCFTYENGSTKIISIWDQSIQSSDNPVGFDYGTEYEKEQIEAQIKDRTSNIVPSKDLNGHGTFLSSVMAANSTNKLFEGIAPDAQIIAVKLKESKKIMKDINSVYNDNVITYESTDVSTAIEYIFRKVVLLKTPCVINVPIATNTGAHDALSFFERYVSGISLTNGIVIVTSVGNEGNKSHHFESMLISSINSTNIEFNVANGEKGFMIDVWTLGPDRMSISLITPLGNVVERRIFTTSETQNYSFILEGTKVMISYTFPDVKNGNQNISIKFIDPTPGLWTLKLYGDLILDGRVVGWLPVSPIINENTVFLNSQVDHTVTIPSTSYNSISVGAFNSRDGGIYTASGRGPALSGRIAPDFVAPGVEITGIYPYNKIGTLTGTSAAAAITSGAAALLLEWGMVLNNDRAMNTLKVKSYLTLGCTQKKESMSYPNALWGYGTLNLFETFQRIR